MADEIEKAAWTIKSMPVDVRLRAVESAAKQGQSMAEWMVVAVNLLADTQERGEVVERGLPSLSAADLSSLIHSVGTMAQGVATMFPPEKSRSMKAEIRRAVAMVDEHVRRVMGELPRPRRKRKPPQIGQESVKLIGQTPKAGTTISAQSLARDEARARIRRLAHEKPPAKEAGSMS